MSKVNCVAKEFEYAPMQATTPTRIPANRFPVACIARALSLCPVAKDGRSGACDTVPFLLMTFLLMRRFDNTRMLPAPIGRRQSQGLNREEKDEGQSRRKEEGRRNKRGVNIEHSTSNAERR